MCTAVNSDTASKGREPDIHKILHKCPVLYHNEYYSNWLNEELHSVILQMSKHLSFHHNKNSYINKVLGACFEFPSYFPLVHLTPAFGNESNLHNHITSAAHLQGPCCLLLFCPMSCEVLLLHFYITFIQTLMRSLKVCHPDVSI